MHQKVQQSKLPGPDCLQTRLGPQKEGSTGLQPPNPRQQPDPACVLQTVPEPHAAAAPHAHCPFTQALLRRSQAFAPHEIPHVEPLHVAVAPAGCWHGVQSPPHVLILLLATQTPPQKCLPGTHPQAPRVQTRPPPLFPHGEPSATGSKLSMQVGAPVEHSTVPRSHSLAGVHDAPTSQTQAPRSQTRAAPQLSPSTAAAPVS